MQRHHFFFVLSFIIFILILSAFEGVLAKDLGVHGKIYPIEEQDLLEVLLSRAQSELDSGQWDRRVDGWRNKAKAQAASPQGITLPLADQVSARLFDPSVIVPDDIKDANGVLLYAAGTLVNPLKYIHLSRQLVFIDGDDKRQVDWMAATTQSAPHQFKVILTNGPILDLMQELGQRLFFDQHQQLANKLGIGKLPTLVSQSGLYLKIEEIAIQ